MDYVAALLLWHAAAGAIPAQPRSIPAALLGVWWVASWVAQSFAAPLLLAALAVAAFAWHDGHVAGVLMAAPAAVLFAFVHLRNRRAARLLLRAMGLADRVPWAAGMWPIVRDDPRVRRIADLSYGDHGVRNRLDLILPVVPPSGPMPVLVHIHGGAWITGHKRQQARPLIHHLAAHGWMVADVNYRLGPRDRMPAMVTDVLRAVAWVREHAAEHGGDPARVAVTGESAGGHLAAMVALAHDDPALKPGFEQADCSVVAAVPLYGRYDMLDRARRAGRNHAALLRFAAARFMPGSPDATWHAMSPMERVRADAPPMLLIHGTGDILLPHEESAAFAAALPDATCVALPGIEHAYDIAASAATWGHVRAVRAFLDRHVNG